MPQGQQLSVFPSAGYCIIWRGLSGKSSLINSLMMNFETSMSGFGMYVKYLMAAFSLYLPCR